MGSERSSPSLRHRVVAVAHSVIVERQTLVSLPATKDKSFTLAGGRAGVLRGFGPEWATGATRKEIMKVYLDDIREIPKGWIGARTYQEARDLIDTGDVKEISLDHDLGTVLTGYDVILWIERQVYFGKIPKPIIHVHTSNPAGRRKIELARGAISRMEVRHGT
jgi:hypothetical protein